MGALHEGHLALMERGKELAGRVAVSLFVNPSQFGPSEDFMRYPRDENRDFTLAESAGVDFMFAPNAEEIYQNQGVWIDPGPTAEDWEGNVRPGHFRGVSTIVLKLLNLMTPTVAIFGMKDLQQCAVVKEMVSNLNVPVDLDFLETVRDGDGLALSSRNAYLTDRTRRIAPLLYQELVSCASVFSKSCQNDSIAAKVLKETNARLTNASFTVDYLGIVDADTMKFPRNSDSQVRILGAAILEDVRLIDNVPLPK